jgi:hypothetical protein
MNQVKPIKIKILDVDAYGPPVYPEFKWKPWDSRQGEITTRFQIFENCAERILVGGRYSPQTHWDLEYFAEEGKANWRNDGFLDISASKMEDPQTFENRYFVDSFTPGDRLYTGSCSIVVLPSEKADLSGLKEAIDKFVRGHSLPRETKAYIYPEKWSFLNIARPNLSYFATKTFYGWLNFDENGCALSENEKTRRLSKARIL